VALAFGPSTADVSSGTEAATDADGEGGVPVALTDIQRRTVEAIVNAFETGSVLGDYAKVTLIPGDTGQLTYGRSQTTLTSGGLHALVCAYCNADDALFAADLRGFLLPLEAADPALNDTTWSRTLLLDLPIQRGLDVRLLQLALSRPGRDVPVVADGLFGPATRAALESFQAATGLPVTGTAEPALFDLLEV
jgi:hypothetical protein